MTIFLLIVAIFAVGYFFLRGVKRANAEPLPEQEDMTCVFDEEEKKWGYSINDFGEVRIDPEEFASNLTKKISAWDETALKHLRQDINSIPHLLFDFSPLPQFIEGLTAENKLGGALARAGFDLAIFLFSHNQQHQLWQLGVVKAMPLIHQELDLREIKHETADFWFTNGMASLGKAAALLVKDNTKPSYCMLGVHLRESA